MGAHLTRSDFRVFKDAAYPMQQMGLMISCGRAVKRIRKLGVSVRKMKTLTVETETLIGIGRYNLTCIVY